MPILGVLVLLALYLGTLYAAPETVKPNAEPSVSSGKTRPPGWNLSLALLALFIFDATVFHSGLYRTILANPSGAANAALLVEAEANRTSQPNEVLVLGDSRVFRGFSADLANNLGASQGIKFIDRSMRGSYPRVWYYLIREMDPAADRYRAIVMPLRSEEQDRAGNFDDRPQDIRLTAPLLRYSDAFDFAASFQKWDNGCAALIACLLRGTAYRADLANFLENPLKRFNQVRRRATLETTYAAPDTTDNLVGLSYDSATGQIVFPRPLGESQRRSIVDSVESLKHGADGGQRPGHWNFRIMERYAAGRTTVFLVQMPRGPLARVVQPHIDKPSVTKAEMAAKGVILIENRAFAQMETPEHYCDGYHPNAKGRESFTDALVAELLLQLNAQAAPVP